MVPLRIRQAAQRHTIRAVSRGRAIGSAFRYPAIPARPAAGNPRWIAGYIKIGINRIEIAVYSPAFYGILMQL